MTILDRDPVALAIVQAGDLVFAEFYHDLFSVLQTYADSIRDSHLKQVLDGATWRTAEGTHHITAAVFQEHPILLLKPKEKSNCNRVEEYSTQPIFIICLAFNHRTASSRVHDSNSIQLV